MYAYNPQKKSYRQLESSMVGKDKWDILNAILEEMDIKKDEGPKQHWLIVGPRGIGKSHLMTLLYYKTKDDLELSKRWIPALLPEELKLAASLPNFLERALEEVLLEFGEKENPVYNELKQKMREVKRSPIPERADNYFSLISWFYEETGKHILLLSENFQQLLGKKLAVIEQKKLRAFLQTSKAILIVGSATNIFGALHDHSQPFYHFFHIRRLDYLGFEDMKILIRHILSQWQQTDLIKKAAGNDARLKTLYSFTGGNPRTAVFLADIFSMETPAEIIEIMARMLDELTPYFHSIVGGIPGYLEEIVNTLAAFEPAQSPMEIAGHLEVPQASIRNYLKLLKDDGYVRVAFSKGKFNYYCLSDYLYRIWFQMRDRSHWEESRWLMELLSMVYSKGKPGKEKNRLEQCFDEKQETFAYKDIHQVLSFIDFEFGNFSDDFDLKEIFDRQIVPLVKNLNPAEYIKQFIGTKESEGKLSNLKLSILLILIEQYDILRDHISDIVKKSLDKKGEEKGEFDLLIFTIKLNTWMKLIEGNLTDALRLVEFYIVYIKALKLIKNKEEVVLNTSLDLFRIQIKYNVQAENIKRVLKRIEDEEEIPFNDAIFKVWTCLAEPESVDAQRYLSEKPVTTIVEAIKEKSRLKKDKEVNVCDHSSLWEK